MTKAVLQMSVDGWMPRKLGYLHPKFKTPWFWLTLFYVIGVLCIFTGLGIDQMANMLLFFSQFMLLLINILVIRLPTVLPEAWAKSKFKVSTPVLWSIVIASALFGIVQIFLLLSYITKTLIIINISIVVLILLFSLWRVKSGKVQMEVSYEYE
jgi:APA family basic amino acid/polyamine antiporter